MNLSPTQSNGRPGLNWLGDLDSQSIRLNALHARAARHNGDISRIWWTMLVGLLSTRVIKDNVSVGVRAAAPLLTT